MRLLTPRNPLAFPGGNPGFDPTHVAARGISNGYGYSVIASAGGLVNLLSGAPATTAATGAGISTVGPTVVALSGSTTASFGGQKTASETVVTLAAILILPASFANGGVCSTSNSTGGVNLEVTSTGNIQIRAQGHGATASTMTPLIANVPLLVGLSYSVANSSVTYFAINLLNGKVSIETGDFFSGVPSADTGTVSMFFGPAISACTGMQMAAAMFAPSFMSKAYLLQWAQSPWDFWYPQTQRSLMFSGIGGSLTQNPLNATPSSDHPGIIKPPEFQAANLMSGLLLPSGPPFLMPQVWL